MTRRTANETSPTFVEHLGEFLRRNLSWFVALGLALLLLQDVFGNHGVLAMRRSQQEAREVQRQINQMNEENRQLEEKVKALKTDPQAIERIAREEMGLARPGEYIFKIPPKPGDGSTAAQPTSQPNGQAAQP
ncbi:MAG TPA: septum formation initiator family protein [Candidatus Baltobacteraceae bacterium]|jgi:cell division protein FtsB|nr:septum formation initiator family protein [Candidatus Baltobacteraceae bacterium]